MKISEIVSLDRSLVWTSNYIYERGVSGQSNVVVVSLSCYWLWWGYFGCK